MDAAQARFEGWAVVELFGHQREAGFITTQYFGNAAMFQLDVPELPEREYELESREWVGEELAAKGTKVRKEAVPARSRLINPSAVYALNPCSEDAARKAIEGLQRREMKIVQLAPEKALTPGAPGPEAFEEDHTAGRDLEEEYEQEEDQIPL